MSQRGRDVYRLRIGIEIDRASLENLRKQIENAITKAISGIKMPAVSGTVGASGDRIITELSKIGVQLSALLGEVSRMIRTMPRILARREERVRERIEEEKKGGIFSSIGGLSGILGRAFGFAAGMGLYDIGRKILDIMLEASPLLRGSIQLFKTMVMLMIKPIADVVGMLLRPLLVSLFPMVMWYYKNIGLPMLKAMVEIEKFFSDFRRSGVVWSPTPPPPFIIAGVGVSGTIGEFGEMPEEFKRKLNELYDKEIAARESFINNVRETLNNFWENLRKAFSLENVMSSIEKVNKFFEEIGVKIKVNDLVQNIKEGVGWLGGELGKIWNGIVDWFKNNFGDIDKKIGEAWGNVVGWFRENFGKIGDKLGEGWNTFVSWIKDKFGNIGAILDTPWNRFVKWFENLGIKIPTFEDIWKGIQEVFGKILDGLKWVYNTLIAPWAKYLGFPEKLQFGGIVERAGVYRLEAGEVVLPKHNVIPAITGGIEVTVPITINAPIYGVDDLERIIRTSVEEAISRVGRKLFEEATRGVR